MILVKIVLFPVFSNFSPTLQLFFVQFCNFLEGNETKVTVTK